MTARTGSTTVVMAAVAAAAAWVKAAAGEPLFSKVIPLVSPAMDMPTELRMKPGDTPEVR